MSNLQKQEGGDRKIAEFTVSIKNSTDNKDETFIYKVRTNTFGENANCTGFLKEGNKQVEFNLNNLSVKDNEDEKNDEIKLILGTYGDKNFKNKMNNIGLNKINNTGLGIDNDLYLYENNEFLNPKNWQPILSSNKVYLKNKIHNNTKYPDTKRNKSFDDLVLYKNMFKEIRDKIETKFSIHSSPTESKVLYIEKIDEHSGRAENPKTYDLYDIVDKGTPAIIKAYLVKDKSDRLTNFFNTDNWKLSGLAKDKFHNVDYLKNDVTHDRIYIKTLNKLKEQGIVFLAGKLQKVMGRESSKLGIYQGDQSGIGNLIDDKKNVVNLDGPPSTSQLNIESDNGPIVSTDSNNNIKSSNSHGKMLNNTFATNPIFNLANQSTPVIPEQLKNCIKILTYNNYTIRDSNGDMVLGGKRNKNTGKYRRRGRSSGGKRKTSKRRTSKK